MTTRFMPRFQILSLIALAWLVLDGCRGCAGIRNRTRKRKTDVYPSARNLCISRETLLKQRALPLQDLEWIFPLPQQHHV